jgi:hypothetical protein
MGAPKARQFIRLVQTSFSNLHLAATGAFMEAQRAGSAQRPTTPKNGAVTCFGNSLQNQEFRELSLGRPGLTRVSNG